MQWFGFIPVIRRIAADGAVLWEEELIANILTNEGQQLLLQLAFQNATLTAFYALLTSAALTETSNLAAAEAGEPSTNGYARAALNRNSTDFPTIGLNIAADHAGTAQAGAASTITLAAAASATDDFYKGCYITLGGGTGQGQVRLITAYTGSSKIATVGTAWKVVPDATTTYTVHSDYMVTSKQVEFAATGGSWGPVDKVALCNVVSGAGKLVSFVPITSQTPASGESILVSYRGTLKAGGS